MFSQIVFKLCQSVTFFNINVYIMFVLLSNYIYSSCVKLTQKIK